MHVIRLHGPWTAELTGPAPTETRRVHLPREWAELAESARKANVAILRRFHRPTGLDESTRVELAIPRSWPVVEIIINEEPQAAQTDDGDLRRFDLSQVIRTREAHDLRIEFRMGDELLTAPCFVGLEITEPAG
jgi:hypothetical protein